MASAASSTCIRSVAALFFTLLFAAASPAQQQGQAPTAGAAASNGAVATNGLIETQLAIVEEHARELSRLQEAMAAGADDDAELVAVRNALEDLGRALNESRAAFRPRLDEINNRLDQIGPPPEEGAAAEPEALKAERAALLEEKADINAVLGEIEKLIHSVNRLTSEIAQIRRELFARQLTKRYDITQALNTQVLVDFLNEVEHLVARVSAWAQFVVTFKARAVLLATALSFLAAAVILFGGRRLFRSLLSMDDSEAEEPSYFSRLSVAFWSTLLPSLAVAVFLGSCYGLLSYFEIMRPDIASLIATTFNVVAIVFLVNRLARAVFSPKRPRWRLVPVDTGAATRLYWLVWVTSFAGGFDFIFSRVNDMLASPLSLTVAKSLLATFVVGLLVILIALVRPYIDGDGRPRGWPRWLRYPLIALGAATIVAGVSGYIGLARFISQQIVVTGAILATMYIGHLTARAMSDIGAFQHTRFGRWLDRRFGANERRKDQLGLVFGIAVNLLVLLIGIPLILLQWGFQWGDISTWVLGVVREIRIGSVSFSLLGVLTGVLVFLIGYFATRWFQRWLDGSVMERGSLDVGVRNSIKTVVGYVGLAVAVLIGISAAGIDLSSLALVAGGLSLGVGFGLQNIVSNFVSGLILLVERPFKSGDWIVAGGVSGTVKKISVRATEIETFQRQSVILPNSELINSAVGNWTHKNRLGRVDIPIGASYEADPRHVHRVLTEIASAHPTILKNPAPMVVFTGFGDSSLDFEVRFFLADVMTQLAIQNDIRFAIYERFKEEGIEIPFPQRDLHIRGGQIDAGARAKPARRSRKAAASAAAVTPEADAETAPRRRPRRRGHLGDE